MAGAAVLPAVVVVVALAAGWDVAGWLREIWTSLTSVEESSARARELQAEPRR
jgi:hypothetical protein